MAYRFWYLDNSRAKAELGLTTRPPEVTLRDTVEYLTRERSHRFGKQMTNDK